MFPHFSPLGRNMMKFTSLHRKFVNAFDEFIDRYADEIIPYLFVLIMLFIIFELFQAIFTYLL
jgi:hypothetical protein